ncbi:hypothetical protein [Pantoea sp. USHLN256]|uniref:hypothetical protein n=1 Tax=Pantoea sp. USHLN256 TaxID=3081293 RepID=UPI00301A3B41
MGNFTKTLVAVVVTSSSLSALADTAAISRGQEAVSHASRMQSAADARVAAAYAGRFTHQGSGLKGVEAMQVDRDAMSQAATARANANAQMAGARNQLAGAVAGGYNLPHQVNVRKNSDMAVALADARQADADRQAKQLSATSYKLGEMQRQQKSAGVERPMGPQVNVRKNSDMAVALADARQAEADRQAKQLSATSYKLGEMQRQQKSAGVERPMGPQVNVRKNSDMAVALADARQADADRQAKQLSATSYKLGEMQRQQKSAGVAPSQAPQVSATSYKLGEMQRQQNSAGVAPSQAPQVSATSYRLGEMQRQQKSAGVAPSQAPQLSATSFKLGEMQRQQKSAGVAPSQAPQLSATSYKLGEMQRQQMMRGVAPAQAPQLSATSYKLGEMQRQQMMMGVAPAQAPQVSATSYKLGEMQRQQMMVGSINVSAASLPGKTPVSLTVNGVSTTTTAAELAAVTPSLQVAVPHIAAFERNPLKGGANGRAMHGHANNDHGNGGSNSEGTHSAEAHGFGNGAHAAAGGGHQGGGFHY